MQKVATVSEIYIFPIKSCAGFLVDKALVTKYGLALVENPQISDRLPILNAFHNHFFMLAIYIQKMDGC